MATNSPEGQAVEFAKRILEVKAHQAEIMARAKEELADDIKEIYKEAEAKGLAVRAIKKALKRLNYENMIKKLDDSVEQNEKELYDAIADQLGPLGQAAAARAGYGDHVPIEAVM